MKAFGKSTVLVTEQARSLRRAIYEAFPKTTLERVAEELEWAARSGPVVVKRAAGAAAPA